MPVDTPKIDLRDQAKLVKQVQELAYRYCPSENFPEAWKKDHSPIQSDKRANALIHIFARMTEIIISRLNKSLDKNFLTFLDLIGVRQYPPRTARAPLTFTMVKGASRYGLIPAGTQVATAETEGKQPVVFETEETLTVIMPKLVKAVSLSPADDKWTDNSPVLFDEKEEGYEELFRGKNLTPHRLYIGHSELFNFKEETAITLEIVISNEKETPTSAQESNVEDIKWYYYDEKQVQKPLEIEKTKPETEQESIPLNSLVGNKIDKEVANLLKSGSITFKPVAGISEKILTGVEKENGLKNIWVSNWIFAELNTPVLSENLPKIRSIKDITVKADLTNKKADLTVNRKSPVTPDVAFFNNGPLDLSKDFYPFGERPKFNDSLYIGSKEVFSKKGAKIVIKVSLSRGLDTPTSENITLCWEFWNGSIWEIIGETTKKAVPIANHDFTDETNAFTFKSQESKSVETEKVVTFTCPNIEEKEINGERNRWIRVRIIEGNYGDEARYEKPSNSTEIGWTYVPSTYKPPSISKLTLQYTTDQNSPEKQIHSEQRVNPEVILLYNDFVYQSCKCSEPFTPFRPVEDEQLTFYLGFDQDISTLPVTIFFPLIGKTIGRNACAIETSTTLTDTNFTCSTLREDSQEDPSLVWQYWTGKEWSELKVEDNTKNLTKRELIQFLAPSDIAKRSCFGFEPENYWVRAKLEKGNYESFPRLKAIYTNTMWARNQFSVQDEILGSSNGKPGQVFKFSCSSVIPGQRVLVMELSLTEEEKHIVISEEQENDAIEEITDNSGNVVGYWVRWHEVEHFHFSNPNSRHYIIDRDNGIITFGDGERGMIPPAERNNIICSYKAGGGAEGNVKAGTITKLRTTFPYVDAVTNPEDADGGSDKEDMGKLIERGPQTLKHRDRAVTCEDFVWLVKEASPKVVRVKCLSTTGISLQNQPGWITLIIVPESDEQKPVPSQQLISEIESYISERTSTYLNSYASHPSQINLIGPGYLKVWVEAFVQFASISEAKTIEGRVIDKLNKFFHPLYGGPEKKGWDFGRNVYISEVYEAIENTEGVDHVESLKLKASAQIYNLTLKGMSLNNSFPKKSKVSIDGKIVLSLAKSLSKEEDVKTINVTGFKEGDSIILRSNDKNVNLIVKSVLHKSDNTLYDVMECEPAWIEDSFPQNSTVETTDKSIKSFTLNSIPANTDISLTPLQIAIPKVKGNIVLTHADISLENASGKITGVENKTDIIFVDDNYLVYSGKHVINKK